MSKTTVLYRDIAVGADEDAAIETTNTAAFSETDQLPFGLTHEPVAVLEPNSWLLDGTRVFRETQRISFWSETLSGSDGVFSDPPVITISFNEQYSAMGLTFTFDPATGEYCSSMNIKWYQGETLKSEMDFTPDKSVYFCSNKVEVFDKIAITLNATNLPYRRAKMDQIIFGLFREFGMSELRSAKIVNQTDLLVDTLPVSKFTWTLDSDDDIGFMFQLKQPVEVSNGGNLIGVYYVDKHSRSASNIYKIECYDAFGVLDESQFDGGVYLDGVSARSLFSEIIGDDFSVQYLAADTTLYGVLKASSRREAAQQVLFAWGTLATTDGRNGIKVFTLDETLKEVTAGRTYTGVTVSTAAIVTEVRLTAHTYTQDSNGSVEVGGAKYDDTETVYSVVNPNVTATTKRNVVKIDGATLVSTNNGQSIAQRVYDYYLRRNTNKAKIAWDGEALGDYVSLPTSWGETMTGHIAKMDINLSNTVAATCETIGG